MRKISLALAALLLTPTVTTAAPRLRIYTGASVGHTFLSWNYFELETQGAILPISSEDPPARAHSLALFAGANFDMFGVEGFLRHSLRSSNDSVRYSATSLGFDVLFYLKRFSRTEIFGGFRSLATRSIITAHGVDPLGGTQTWNLRVNGIGYGMGGGVSYYIGNRMSLRASLWNMTSEGVRTPSKIEASASVIYWF